MQHGLVSHVKFLPALSQKINLSNPKMLLLPGMQRGYPDNNPVTYLFENTFSFVH